MDSESRSALTVMLWVVSGLTIAAIFCAGAIGTITTWHIIFAFLMLGLAIGGTPIMLNWQSDTELEKAKRQRIDNLLRDMSDDDLVALKKRLADGDMGEDTILDFISDDGELVIRNNNNKGQT